MALPRMTNDAIRATRSFRKVKALFEELQMRAMTLTRCPWVCRLTWRLPLLKAAPWFALVQTCLESGKHETH